MEKGITYSKIKEELLKMGKLNEAQFKNIEDSAKRKFEKLKSKNEVK